MSDELIDDLAAERGAADVLAALAEATAETPPPALRSQLLATVGSRPRAGVAPAAPGDLYARRVEALHRLLVELDDADWALQAAPYRWSVIGLVAHLAVIEEYTARQLGLTGLPPLPAGEVSAVDHLAMGAAEIDELAGRPPLDTVARWRAAADQVVAHVRSAGFDGAAPVVLHEWPFSASTAMIVRSFELWTHADDIRRATGRPLDTLSAAELGAMSGASVNGLPVLLALGGRTELPPIRVVLTGAGGATFDLGGPGPVRNLLVADVVDYCRVVSRRLDPDALVATRDGDAELIGALLRASQTIAV